MFRSWTALQQRVVKLISQTFDHLNDVSLDFSPKFCLSNVPLPFNEANFHVPSVPFSMVWKLIV